MRRGRMLVGLLVALAAAAGAHARAPVMQELQGTSAHASYDGDSHLILADDALRVYNVTVGDLHVIELPPRCFRRSAWAGRLLVACVSPTTGHASYGRVDLDSGALTMFPWDVADPPDVSADGSLRTLTVLGRAWILGSTTVQHHDGTSTDLPFAVRITDGRIQPLTFSSSFDLDDPALFIRPTRCPTGHAPAAYTVIGSGPASDTTGYRALAAVDCRNGRRLTRIRCTQGCRRVDNPAGDRMLFWISLHGRLLYGYDVRTGRRCHWEVPYRAPAPTGSSGGGWGSVFLVGDTVVANVSGRTRGEGSRFHTYLAPLAAGCGR